jgi:chemotaxis protein CheC
MVPLSDEKLEAMEELLNLGMGQAAAALSNMLNGFVRLSVPSVTFVEPGDMVRQARALMPGPRVCAVRQGFHDGLVGEAVNLYDPVYSSVLAKLLGVGEEEDVSSDEIVMEVSNLYISACLSGIAQQLNREIAFYPPVLIGNNYPIEDVFTVSELTWKRALLTQICLSLEDNTFTNKLLLFLPEESWEALDIVLTEFIESLG